MDPVYLRTSHTLQTAHDADFEVRMVLSPELHSVGGLDGPCS